MNASVRHPLRLRTASRRLRPAAALLVLFAFAASASAQQESLGDYARKLRRQKRADVLISSDDAAQMFRSVDEITAFSSQDSGLPRLAPVKRKLIGQIEAEQHFSRQNADDAHQESRVDTSLVVLKKFGLLPANFDLNASLGNSSVGGIAGFYDFSDKTMYLLNWIAPELQKMVMAHELTHALQDQNFDLTRFAGRQGDDPDAKQMNMQRDDHSEVFLARRAVIEGQASLVGDDYELNASGAPVTLAGSEMARNRAESYLQASYDPPVIIHNAPRLLRETLMFPYREGLLFELEVLSRRGREAAFQGTFRRPPVDTHQILQPAAYLNNENSPQVLIPDLAPVFGSAWQAYDSGTVGEFDVQIMSEDFGIENDIYTVARKWDGGSYVAVRRAHPPAGVATRTADIALVYLSHWKTQQAAERFGQIYLKAIARRLPMGDTFEQRCDESSCPGPLWQLHATGSEGPVHVELYPGNVLLITQSVEEARMPALRSLLIANSNAATRNSSAAVQSNSTQASADARELATLLFDLPQFQALSSRAGLALNLSLRRYLAH